MSRNLIWSQTVYKIYIFHLFYEASRRLAIIRLKQIMSECVCGELILLVEKRIIPCAWHPMHCPYERKCFVQLVKVLFRPLLGHLYCSVQVSFGPMVYNNILLLAGTYKHIIPLAQTAIPLTRLFYAGKSGTGIRLPKSSTFRSSLVWQTRLRQLIF